jgi:hypothetical protein
MKVYYIANVRMPSEKAYGIQLAKMCEAFILHDLDLTLVVPNRGAGSLKSFYRLRVEVPMVILPSIVLKRYERLGFVLMGVSFMLSYKIFLLWKKFKGEKFVLYTADMDSFS